jgi:hypothetical protein
MRSAATAIVMFTLSLSCVCTFAEGLTDSPTALADLQAKVDQAQPRDRCFLYAELVNRMTNLAGQQLNAGDSVEASETLKLIQRYADKIQMGIVDDSKKLKPAELLMRRTSFRLEDILRDASYEDRPALEATLTQMNKVRAQLMMQAFKK